MSLSTQLLLGFFVGGPLVALLVLGAVAAIQVRHVVLGAWASTGGLLPRPKRRLAHEQEEEEAMSRTRLVRRPTAPRRDGTL